MRTRARVDDNHAAIVTALRRLPGVSVRSTAALGDGFPDLIVGLRGRNLLLEVKASPKAKLTNAEDRFFVTWLGHCARVDSVDEAVAVVLRAKREGD